MSDKVFVDTNVLIYAHDIDASTKHQTARSVLEELWSSRCGVISSQVLQEFYVNVTRKIPTPLKRSQARAIIASYATWQVETIGPSEIHSASELEERNQLSFWDALIVTSAISGGASKILTEDLNAGQRIGGVLIENPFGVS